MDKAEKDATRERIRAQIQERLAKGEDSHDIAMQSTFLLAVAVISQATEAKLEDGLFRDVAFHALEVLRYTTVLVTVNDILKDIKENNLETEQIFALLAFMQDAAKQQALQHSDQGMVMAEVLGLKPLGRGRD